MKKTIFLLGLIFGLESSRAQDTLTKTNGCRLIGVAKVDSCNVIIRIKKEGGEVDRVIPLREVKVIRFRDGSWLSGDESAKIFSWENVVEYPCEKFHFYFGGGGSFEPTRQDWHKEFPMGMGRGYFGGAAREYFIRTGLTLGLDYAGSRKWRMGLWMLPAAEMEFEGAKGTNGTSLTWFSGPAEKGQYVRETCIIKTLKAETRYVLLPCKHVKRVGMEISAGGGLLFNFFEVSTQIKAYDFIPHANSPTEYFTRQGDFKEKFRSVGTALSLNMDLFLGKFFSLGLKILGGESGKMHVAEKYVGVMSTTAHVPAHTIRLEGISCMINAGMHFSLKPGKKRQG